MLSPRIYRLSKSRHCLQWAYAWYKKKASTLSSYEKNSLEEELAALDAAILAGDRVEANTLARRVEQFLESRYQRSYWSYGLEIVTALLIALLIAAIVRQMWFENHEIPSGSMRPTYLEQDHLIVSKTPFGINTPFATGHLYFDPSLVERTTVFTFSADGIPMSDADTTYFGVFPYKKRLIKRLMGKPGDTLYFYGGKVYGIDSKGQDLHELRDAPWMENLEYIPFLNFSGEVEQPRAHTFILKLMNLPLAKIERRGRELLGQIFNGKSWIPDDPMAAQKPHDSPQTYSDFWGIANFAMVQLLTPEQITANGDSDLSELGTAPLYLEIRHHPNVSNPAPLLLNQQYGNTIALRPLRSYIPLQTQHLTALMKALYTARFVIKDGAVYRYGAGTDRAPPAWHQEGIPDGTYEFYHGTAQEIGWGGIAYEVPTTSALYDSSSSTLQHLFNLGIDLHPIFGPHGDQQLFFPHRYAYFRDGDLYIMGAPILKKEDPTLVAFNAREKKREDGATSQHPYIAFKDRGPPLSADGQIDKAFLASFGLHIPEKHYLALGDNHAMSGDSRIWGFVPENNLQGTPSFVYWPPSPRWGWAKEQPELPWLTIPHLLIWGAALFIALAALIWRYQARRRPIFHKIESSGKDAK